MEKRLHKFLISNRKTSGMALLYLPTGTGKTFHCTNFICNYKLNGGKKRIFYTTTLIRNIPKNSLKKRFKKAHKTEFYDQHVLILESNAESARRFFTETIKVKGYENRIDDDIKGSEEYVALKSFVTRNNAQIKKDTLDKAQAKELRDLESAFRHLIKRLLVEKYKTLSEREYAVKEGKYSWVGEMYPSVWVKDKDKDIVFLSVAKLMKRIDPIYTASFYLYDDDIINGSFFFIDEIDSTKEAMLNEIINNGEFNKMDLLQFFAHIYDPILKKGFPTEFTQESVHVRESRNNSGAGEERSPQGRLDAFIDELKKFSAKYHMNWNIRTDRKIKKGENSFIFHVRTFHTVTDENPWVKWNEAAKINDLLFHDSDACPDESLRLRYILGGIQGIIESFRSCMRVIANNYWYLMTDTREPGRTEQSYTKETFPYEYSMSSCLANFRDLTYAETQYLTSPMENSSMDPKKGSSGFDSSFYSTGFSIYDCADDPSRNMRTDIIYKSFELTPEKILLAIARRAKVTGISATANLPTVIGNFDMDYLRSALGARFYEFSDEDKDDLAADFLESVKHYDRTHITAMSLPGTDPGDCGVKWWKRIIDDDSVANTLMNAVDIEIDRIDDVIKLPRGKKKDDTEDSNIDKDETFDRLLFYRKRYYNIAAAYSLYKQKGLRSFLCLLNKYPSAGDPMLNEDTLKFMFAEIDRYWDPGCAKSYVILRGKDFEKTKDEAIEALGNGEKRFLITVYAAGGLGQNMQFRVPACSVIGEDVVLINDIPRDDTDEDGNPAVPEMDIEGIYLDDPTNLLVNISQSITNEQLDLYIFQTEYLYEHGELTYDQAMNNIREAFKKRCNPYYDAKTCKGTRQSINWLTSKYIRQGVGRICRTNIKAKEIYVIVNDDTLRKLAECPLGKDDLVNLEFKAIMDLAAKHSSESAAEEKRNSALINRNNEAAVHAKKYVTGLRKSKQGWTSEKIQNWRSLRDLTLKFPTASNEDIRAETEETDGNMTDLIDETGRDIIWNFYDILPVKGNKIFYSQEGDFDIVNTSFTKTDKCSHEVSAENARLPELLSIDGVREFFNEKHYPVTFKDAENILDPYLFTSVYKGALGEVIGRFLMHKDLGLELVDIEDPEIFEFFDFVHTPTKAFFDFKHRMAGLPVDKEKMYKIIRRKMAASECSAVFIINIIADDGEEYLPIYNEEIENVYEIPYLYLVPSGKPNTAALNKIREVLKI